MTTEQASISTCSHEDITIEKPCCFGPNIECACAGRSEVVCNNPHCDGIDDTEVDMLLEQFVVNVSDCY